MPPPESKKTMVVRCKGIGCGWNVPSGTEAVSSTITVFCPVCLERRAYIVSTEVFLGEPSWEIMRAIQGRR
jgi:hypothetical protein